MLSGPTEADDRVRVISRLFAALLLATTAASCGSDADPAPVDAVAQRSLAGSVILDGATDHGGVVVTLAGPASSTTVTDAAGAYSFATLPVGRYALLFTAPSTREGTLATTIEIVSDDVRAADVHFTALGELRGKATFGRASGNAGITVTVAGTSAIGVTDDAGGFTIGAVPAGTRDVIATAPSFGSAIAKAVTVAYKTTTPIPDLVLKPSVSAGSIRGKVTVTGETDHRDVVITASGSTSAAAVTDATGAFTVNGLADGRYIVVASAESTVEGTKTIATTVTGGATQTVADLAFQPVGAIEGVVTLGGKATGNAGAIVYVDGAPAAFTDDAGAYRLRSVPTGSKTVRASKEGFATASVLSPRVPWKGIATAPTFDLAPDATTTSTISGIATHYGGTAHEGTTITLRAGGPTATTGVTGAYSLGPILGSSQHDLIFKSKDGIREEVVGRVLAIPGSPGFLVRDSLLQPIPAVALPRGRWIAAGANPRVTTDGTKVVFEPIGAGNAKLVIVPATGGTPKPLFQGEIGHFEIARGDQRVIVRATDYSYWASPFDTGTPVKIAPAIDKSAFLGSPDGSYALYHAPSGGEMVLFSASMTTGVARALGVVSPAGPIVVSPDGRLIAFTRVETVGGPGTLRIASVAGDKAWDVGPATTNVSWTPDGTRVVYFSTATTLSTAAATEGATPRTLAGGQQKPVIVSPDSKYAVFENGAGITLVSLTTADPPVTIASGNNPVFSPDSKRFLWSDGGRVMVASVATPTVTTTLESSGQHYHRVEFLGTGQAVLIHRGDVANGNLFEHLLIADLTTNIPKLVITSARNAQLRLVVSNSRTKIAVVEGEAGVHKLGIASIDGTFASLTTDADGVVGFSPDETRLLFERSSEGKRSTWVVPVAGGTPVALIDAPGAEWIDASRILLAHLTDSASPLTFAFDGIYIGPVP